METLQHALFPTYPQSIEEAIEKLASKQLVSIALNDKFMLSLNFTTDNKIQFPLFYSNKCIGHVTKEVVKLGHPLFKQELLDNCNLFKPYRIEF